jgi:hypothetical protein
MGWLWSFAYNKNCRTSGKNLKKNKVFVHLSSQGEKPVGE